MPNDMHDAVRAEALVPMRGAVPAEALVPAPPRGAANLAAALASAQARFRPVAKDRTVKVKTERGSYDFRYATLDNILGMALPILSEHGLALSHVLVPQERGPMMLVTRLMHVSGEVLESAYPITPQGNSPQAVGSAISYGRRYSISALLCISADDDDDGNAAAGHHVEYRQEQRKPPPHADERERDGSRPAWVEMEWPIAQKGGGYEDMRDPDVWLNTIGQWVSNITARTNLETRTKLELLQTIQGKMWPIIRHIRDRGDYETAGRAIRAIEAGIAKLEAEGGDHAQ